MPDKKFLKKYELTIRLFEIDRYFGEKYKLPEYINSLKQKDEDDNGELVLNLNYEQIKNRYEKNILTPEQLAICFVCLEAVKNDDISPETEEFWKVVEEEKLLKRKNNRLQNILKKGYLSNFEDEAIFLPVVDRVLNSEIYGKIYGVEIYQKISNFIENYQIKLIEKGIAICEKKKPLEMDKFKLKDIIIKFEHYDILKISSYQLQVFRSKYENFVL